MIELSVDGFRIIPKKIPLLVSGNVYKVSFTFSSEWDNLNKVVLFKAGGKSVATVLDDTNEVVVPWEVLDRPYVLLEIGVYSANEEAVRISAYTILGEIKRGTELENEPPSDYTPSLYDQLIAAAGEGTQGSPGPPGDATLSGGLPAGCIVIWSGSQDTIPDGWVLCDGQNGSPDLRDKFVLGAGTKHSVAETGGDEKVTLTIEQMPRHAHTYDYHNISSRVNNTSSTDNRFGWNPIQNIYVTGDGAATIDTGYAGYSEPHPNMPPYYTLCYIMKVD